MKGWKAMTSDNHVVARVPPRGALTLKQAAFVREYLVDCNATQAAIRAGYSAKTANEQGARLLTNVSVAAAIAQGRERQTARTELTEDYVINGLRTVADRCLQTDTFDPNGASRALELLGKRLQLFTDKVDTSGTLTVRVVREETSE